MYKIASSYCYKFEVDFQSKSLRIHCSPAPTVKVLVFDISSLSVTFPW